MFVLRFPVTCVSVDVCLIGSLKVNNRIIGFTGNHYLVPVITISQK